MWKMTYSNTVLASGEWGALLTDQHVLTNGAPVVTSTQTRME